MVVSSRAELVSRVRDRPGRRDQIFQGNALVRRRPLLVDADVARAVLHGGDPVRMLPSPTLPRRPQPPTTAGAPVASRCPSASEVTRGWSGLTSIGSWNQPSSVPFAGIVIS